MFVYGSMITRLNREDGYAINGQYGYDRHTESTQYSLDYPPRAKHQNGSRRKSLLNFNEKTNYRHSFSNDQRSTDAEKFTLNFHQRSDNDFAFPRIFAKAADMQTDNLTTGRLTQYKERNNDA